MSAKKTRKPRTASPPAASAWLKQLLQQLARAAMADARRMTQFPSSSLHALRVRMKKLRALLRLADAVIPAGTMDSLTISIREVKDPLAPARDAEVLRKTATRFDAAHTLPHSAADSALPDLQPVLRRLQQRLARLDLGALQWTGITQAHNKIRRRTRKAMKRSKRSGEASDFHRWRRRVKDLYFQRLALHGNAKGAKPLRRLRKLARFLGNVQDLAMLEEHLGRFTAADALLSRIASERDALQRKALRKGRKVAK